MLDWRTPIHELAYTSPPSEMMPKSKAASTKALQLDDSVSDAHAALAWVLWRYDWNFPEAEKEFRRAIELAPNSSSNGRGMYPLFLYSMKRFDQGAAEHKQAIALEPLNLISNTNIADGLYYAHQYDRAIEQYQKTLELDANFSVCPLGARKHVRPQRDVQGSNRRVAKGIVLSGRHPDGRLD